MMQRQGAASWASCLRAVRPSASASAWQPRAQVAEAWRCASSSSKGGGQTEYAASSSLPASVVKARAGASSASPAVDRTKSKLPTAKAKAQASKALRQQLQASRAARDPSAQAATYGRAAAPDAEDLEEQIIQDHHAQASQAATKPPAHAAPPQLQETVAWATADSYDFGALIRSGRLPTGWTLLEDDEAIHVPAWPPHAQFGGGSTAATLAGSAPAAAALSPAPGTGEVFIFSSGAYVTWGLSEEQSHRFLRSVIRGRPAADLAAGRGKRRTDSEPQVERETYHHIGEEGMEWVWHADEPTRIVGDVIVLGHAPRSPPHGEVSSDASELSLIADALPNAQLASTPSEDDDWTPLLARLAYSQGLARSARLSAQEEALDVFLSSVNSIPEQLEAAGKVPLPRKEVIRKMGTLLRLRQRANLGKDNFLDDPEGHWDNGSLEYHYDEICRSLDIEPRFRALNEKLDHGENLLGVIRALLTERSSHRMELIIIYLIALEATLALISHDYVPTPARIYRLFTGRGWNAEPAPIPHDQRSVASGESAPENVEIGLTIGLLRRALSLLDLQGEEAQAQAQVSSSDSGAADRTRSGIRLV